MNSSILQLKEQFSGHRGEKILIHRQLTVNKFLDNYPDFLNTLVNEFSTKFKDTNLNNEIQTGNVSSVEKLRDLHMQLLIETPEYEVWKNLHDLIDSKKRGVNFIIENTQNLLREFAEDWVSQGKTTEFDLCEFTWSDVKTESFSKKEKKNKSPSTVQNMLKNTIPNKQTVVDDLATDLCKLENDKNATEQFSRLNDLTTYIDANEDWGYIVSIQKKIHDIMYSSGSSDGGFELSLTEEHIKAQWFPQRQGRIKQFILETGEEEEKASEIVERLEILKNVQYVLEYKTDGLDSNGKSRLRRFPCEQDILIYDPVTGIVYDCGEAKSNYNDLGHADKQLLRDKTIILRTMLSNTGEGKEGGEKTTLEGSSEFQQYIDDKMIKSTYIAKNKYNVDTPLFVPEKCTPLLNSYSGFIVTKEAQPCRLAVPSTIEFQIANWLYSSKAASDEFVQENIDKIIDSLNYKSIETICGERDVFVITS